MPQLNQILAIEKTRKNIVEKAKTAYYHAVQRPALFSGLTREYSPYEDGGETLPSEGSMPQLDLAEILNEFRKAQVSLTDLVATKDKANTKASGAITVTGPEGPVSLAEEVPVTTLLFLEKQLTDLRTVLSSLPVTDPSETWEFDPNTNTYRSRPLSTVRTKKTPRVLSKAAATKEHPEQVEVWYEDIGVGTWTTTKFSTALPAAAVKAYLDRVEVLLEAVKAAREQANGIDVDSVELGKRLYDYILAPTS